MLEHGKASTWLQAPALHNSSCAARPAPGAAGAAGAAGGGVTLWAVTQAMLVLLLSVAILAANLTAIVVLNSRRYSKYIHAQPRYLLTSLASNDLAIGLLVTPFGVLPAVYRCWPYGEIFCQIQSLLRGALRQQSAVILICMAIDRYMCTLHPARYHRHSSKKGCVAVMSATWAASVTVFAALVLPRGGYYFNSTGLLACDPFFPRASLRILAACLFYFPTTMVLMYCYGSVFHANKLRLKRVVCSAHGHSHGRDRDRDRDRDRERRRSDGHAGHGYAHAHAHAPDLSLHPAASAASPPLPEPPPPPALPPAPSPILDKAPPRERRISCCATRSMAAMSLGFIVLVTPWTLQEVVAACTGSKAPPFLDFLATWLALSHSFWSPFLFWLLDGHFRRVCRTLLLTKIWCRRRSKARCPGSPRDLECLSEQRWGEILERAVSSSSLQALQRLYGPPELPPPAPPPRALPEPPPAAAAGVGAHI